MIATIGVSVLDVLQQKRAAYDDLDLGNPKWSDEDLIDFMIQHPILINRPIVATPLGTRLCRPSEAVLEILSRPQNGPFSKEDGELVIDKHGYQLV